MNLEMSELNKIYQELSTGTISRKEALQRIREVKLKSEEYGTILCDVEWQLDSLSEEQLDLNVGELHFLLIDSSERQYQEIKTLHPNAEILRVESNYDDISSSFISLALECFNRIRSGLKNKSSSLFMLNILIFGKDDLSLYAGLSGLLKSAMLETPRFIGKIIFMLEVEREGVKSYLEPELKNTKDTLVKYQNGDRFTKNCQLIETQKSNQSQSKIQYKPYKEGGVYLITGGLGKIGLLVAQHILSSTKSAKVLLTGRSKLSDKIKEKFSEIGTSVKQNHIQRVEYVQLDLGSLERVRDAVQNIIGTHTELTGIFHCAGMTSDDFIIKKSSKSFSDVLNPKVLGTYNLEIATQSISIDFIVLFSSVASWFGNIGQADYAVANSFLDQFAYSRNTRRLVDNSPRGRCVSINWPLWENGGMKISKDMQLKLRQEFGSVALSNEAALEALDNIICSSSNQVLVENGYLPKLNRQIFGSSVQSENDNTSLAVQYYDAASESKRVSYSSQILDSEDFHRDDATREEPQGEIIKLKARDFIAVQLSKVLKIPKHKLKPDSPLEEYGIDSIIAINLTNQLEKVFGTLSKTLFFEYRSISELTDYFIDSHLKTFLKVLGEDRRPVIDEHDTEMKSSNPSNVVASNRLRQNMGVRSRFRQFEKQLQTKPKSSKSKQPLVNQSTDIAIVGISGRYPESIDIGQFWENLRDGKDCITVVPQSRWRWQDYYSEDRSKEGKHFSKWGGFIDGVDEFDPVFFNISPKEAHSIDPQERLFLQHTWCAIEDAGFTRDSLQIPKNKQSSAQVGVYVGVMYGEYNLSGSLASIANRVSYFLNLHGPSITLDTMCSSSLTAIHLACQDLKLGKTDLGIAGGVNISVHPSKYLMLSEAQFISSAGSCQSFGVGGDGYIPGEGVGTVILQRLSDAESEGRCIYGLIKGTAINHGGKTNGFSVPNPTAQCDAIASAIKEAGIDPRHISYIEAHGTGTKLGDPIEVAALSKAFKQISGENELKTGACLLGSAKSNIGHCESAAGIAGLTKVLLQMKYHKVVPSLHSTTLNPHIDFATTPFIVNQELVDWQRPVIDGKEVPRIAGVSSFGAGGANAHILIEEYHNREMNLLKEQQLGLDEEYILPLSARNSHQLEQKISQLLEYLTAHDLKDKINAIAYTLQMGRESLNERIAIIVTSYDELIESLQRLVNKESTLENVFYGQAKNHGDTLSVFSMDSDLRSTIEKWIKTRQFRKLLELWVNGLEVDWSIIYEHKTPTFLSLPTYPFSKEKYWIDPVQSKLNNIVQLNSASALHPLVHFNTSDFNQISFSSRFSGNEFFLKEINDAIKLLPKSAVIEMINVVFKELIKTEANELSINVSDLVWGAEVIVNEDTKVTLALFEYAQSKFGFELYNSSNEQGEIYCQGYVYLNDVTKTDKVDIQLLEKSLLLNEKHEALDGILSLYKNSDTAIAQFSVGKNKSSDLTAELNNFRTINWCIENSSRILNDNPNRLLLDSIGSCEILSNCEETMFVHAKYVDTADSSNQEEALDIDLLDSNGKLCIRLMNVRYVELENVKEATSVEKDAFANSKPIAKESLTSSDSLEVKQNFLSASQGQPIEHISKNKPKAISLRQPSASMSTLPLKPVGKTSKPAVKLSTDISSDNSSGSSPSVVSLHELNNGVVTVQISDTLNKNLLIEDTQNQLLDVFKKITNLKQAKVVTVKGLSEDFLHGGEKELELAAKLGIFDVFSSLSVPTIAIMQGSSSGVGWILGTMADFVICSENSHYQLNGKENRIYATSNLLELFHQRYGRAFTTAFFNKNTGFDGKELLDIGWCGSIVGSELVDVEAQNIIDDLLSKSNASMALLKSHLATPYKNLTKNIAKADVKPSGLKVKNYVAKIAKLNRLCRWLVLEEHDKSTLILKIKRATKAFSLQGLINDLNIAFVKPKTKISPKIIVLKSNNTEFIPTSDAEEDSKYFSDLAEMILSIPVPIIAALENNAHGISWLVSQLCDVCVYSQKGSYSCAELLESRHDIPLLNQALSWHFGAELAKRILFEGIKYRGSDLKDINPALIMNEKINVLDSAKSIAENWCLIFDAENLLNSKRDFLKSRVLLSESHELSEVSFDLDDENECVSGELKISSSVVNAKMQTNGVLVVEMQDREGKNTFTDALVKGLNDVFEYVEKSSSCKAVVLTGYDTYFSSGGTKESLLAIQQGHTKFTDTLTFRLALDCKVPVIAAINGHAIGAGLTLGLFADFVILSKESRYRSPYMNYGFTPGAGATYIIPEKLGYDLANKSLMLAKEFDGVSLSEKLPGHYAVSRNQVLSQAMQLSSRIASFKQPDLIAIKKSWTNNQKQQLDEILEKEVTMHEKTFVGQSETLQRINDTFLREGRQPRADAISQSATIESSDTTDLPIVIDLPAVTETIKALLSTELHLPVEEIDNKSQFVELGLDSITGVTWVKNINQEYKLSLDATKVYSYPSIAEFSQLVVTELKANAVDSDTSAMVVNRNIPGNDANGSSESVKVLSKSEVLSFLKEHLAHELHLNETDIEDNSQFVDLGLDSITGVTLIRKINKALGLNVEATKVYSYPTVYEFSNHIQQSISDMNSHVGFENKPNITTINKSTKTTNDETYARNIGAKDVKPGDFSTRKLESWRGLDGNDNRLSKRHASQEIAVIGLAGQFPQASDVEQFWQNIADGKNCISEVPSNRWDINQIYQEGNPQTGKTNSKWMGALEEFDQFDPLFFTISPTEAESMDPQQRLFLQACWHGIENAGYNADELSGSKCGVFVGCAAGDYNLISKQQQVSAQGFTGAATSILAARISYFLNLQGPCLSIDTACSSSLVAIANACDSLNSGASDLALAGGVYVMSRPDMLIKTSQSGMLSTKGRCFTFDQRANGFVAGEAVGVVLLKRLLDAQADNDIIQGVIKGWGVNQDGKTNGITAPNAESQTRLEQDVYDKFEIEPEKIQLIEAHGTGTKLGDPIEIEGLKNAFKKYTSNVKYCALGSVKSNIGHCLTAAGIAGVIKLVLAFKNKQLPPTTNFETLNEHINLEHSPFYINRELQDWVVDSGQHRLAAVSSFGFSGTNAHMVLSEFVSQDSSPEKLTNINSDQLFVVPLSAKNDERLLQKAKDLLDFIQQQDVDFGLAELSYTLQVGRQAMESRLAILAKDVKQLTKALGQFIEPNKKLSPQIYTGQVKVNKEGLSIISQDDEVRDILLKKWLKQKDLKKLANIWVKGLEFDWKELHDKAKPNRIVLPNYPFQKEHYWLEETASAEITLPEGNSNYVHPMLHNKIQDLEVHLQERFLESDSFAMSQEKDNATSRKTQLPKKIELPTYPFARERLWVESPEKQVELQVDNQPAKNLDSIKDIFEQIDNGQIEASSAVKKLKELA